MNTTHINMDSTHKQYMEQNKPQRKQHKWYDEHDFIYMQAKPNYVLFGEVYT